MDSMFEGCSVFNQSFYNWDVSLSEINNEIVATKQNVSTTNLFKDCTNLEYYYVNGNVTNSTFKGAYILFKTNTQEYELKHRPFTSLDLFGVSSMDDLFKNEDTFNEDISNWNTSNVTSMVSLFEGASSFNQPIEIWNISNVSSLDSLFEGASSFNRPIEIWDISYVSSLNSVFKDASSFNQDISIWDVTNITNMGVIV